MIEKIVLTNFQIHEKSVLIFDKNFNVIEGKNDSGKSSIVRALYWTFYNEPSGDWMCRIDDNGVMQIAEVKIKFDDGLIIKRIKGPSVNKYVVDDEEYENFGYSIPQQVLEKLKIYPFVTNKEEFKIHIAMQDEKSFLIHESAPVRASILDSLTGVSLVQKAISEFNKETLNLSRKLTTISERNVQINDELNVIPDINNIQLFLDEIKLKEKYKKEVKESVDKIEKLKLKYECENKRLLLAVVPEVGLEYIETVRSKLEKLNSVYVKLKTIRDRYNSLQKFNGTVYDNTNLDGLGRQRITLERNLQQLVRLQKQWFENVDKKDQADAGIGILELELQELKEKLKLCPTCGKPLDE